MSKQSISSKWICECTTENPLRKRCCVSCGRGVPKDFLKKVYKEEIYHQKSFFRMLKHDKEIARCKKVGFILEKMQTVMIVFFIIAIITCNGARFYYCCDTADVFTYNYCAERTERLTKEKMLLSEHFIGVKQLPVVISSSWLSMWESIGDVKVGISKNSLNDNKNLNEDKVNHIKEKIMEVKNYVTGKFE